MKTTNHKWQVPVYLGKELYEELEEMAKTFEMPLSRFVRITLQAGVEISQMQAVKEAISNAAGQMDAQ